MKLTFVLLLVFCACHIECVRSFDIPVLSQIYDKMSSFTQNIRSETATEIKSGTAASQKRTRVKRQSTNIGDESTVPHEIRSSSLPLRGSNINTRYMPSIGNGYLGATIYDDAIFMNGVYAGTGGETHRAAIPALLMGRITIANDEIDRRASRKYTLNALEGYFMESIDCEYGIVHHKMYLHEKYIRLFVVDTYARLKDGANGGLMLNVKYPSLNSSTDFQYGTPVAYQGGSLQLSMNTKTAERGAKTQSIVMFYNQPLEQIPIFGTLKQINLTQVMAVDKSLANARLEFDVAQRILETSSWALFEEHATAWRKTWNAGRLELQGKDSQLMKAIWFAQYYLLSSLPSLYASLPPPFAEPFYGLGRTGLARGKVNKDYQGHVMWDNEYYLLPAVLPFHPYLAKQMLRYRSATAAQAAENAKKFDSGVGYHYAWESAMTGAEVTPDPCPAENPRCHWNRYFVTAGVSYAIRVYYSMTRDIDYMRNTVYSGCDVSREIARFLANQAIYNPVHGRYDMNGITGPDEFHPNVNNNAFTLCASSLAIHWARYFSCLCQRNERVEVPDEYIQKALYLNLPYDNMKRLHYAFEGFDPETDNQIKQADTIMLNYPLNWNYSVDIMKNDLQFYELMISDNTPAMTYSWLTIGWKWVNEDSKMRSYFLKSYQDYIIQPFKIWTEYTERNQADQDAGNVNFLPGMGAFLQSIIYGFAGFRIRPDKLEVHNPTPPPGADSIKLINFNYLGSNMTFTITADKTILQMVQASTVQPLILRRNITGAVEESLTAGTTTTIEKSQSNGFFIYSSVLETCEHPRDYIYMPWGYSPWIDSAPTISRLSAVIQLVVTILVVLVISRF